MLFTSILAGLFATCALSAPLSVTVKVNTCSSYFINLEYECSQAGLVGAKDPNLVCPGDYCTLAYCCKYSVPQLTPGKPGVPTQKTPPVPQKIPPVPQKTPPVPQKTPPVPQKTPPVPQKTPPVPQNPPSIPINQRMTCSKQYRFKLGHICQGEHYKAAKDGSHRCRGARCTVAECCQGRPIPESKRQTCAGQFTHRYYDMCIKEGYKSGQPRAKICMTDKCDVAECCSME